MCDTKTCTKCGETKSLLEFYKDKGQLSGLRPDCKSCNKLRCRDWAIRNPEKRKFYVLKSATGVTEDSYTHLLNKQECKCAICGKSVEDNGKKLAVDHNHTTGLVRGLLCNNCNLGVGYFADDISLLRKAIDYITDPINKDEGLIYKLK